MKINGPEASLGVNQLVLCRSYCWAGAVALTFDHLTGYGLPVSLSRRLA